MEIIKCLNEKFKKFSKKLAIIEKTGYNIKSIRNKEKERDQISLLSFEKEEIMANIEEKVETLLKPKIEAIGYELYDVLYLKERKELYFKNSNR